MRVEDRMRQVTAIVRRSGAGTRAGQALGNAAIAAPAAGAPAAARTRATIARRHPPSSPSRRARCRSRVVRGVPEVDARRERPLAQHRATAAGHSRLDAQRVEVRVVHLREAQRREAAARGCRASAWTRAGDRLQTRAARGTRRRSPPCSAAAPAPCRCSTSPSRAGCAARASAAPCGTPDGRCASTDTPMMRPGAWRT